MKKAQKGQVSLENRVYVTAAPLFLAWKSNGLLWFCCSLWNGGRILVDFFFFLLACFPQLNRPKSKHVVQSISESLASG